MKTNFTKKALMGLFLMSMAIVTMSFTPSGKEVRNCLTTSFSVVDNDTILTSYYKRGEIDIPSKDNGYFIGCFPQVLPSCSTQSVTFQCVTPVIGTGTFTFKWTVGPGWTNSGTIYTGNNYLILIPSSPTATPSSVSVTAYFTNNNGNSSAYDVGSCSVYRASTFTSNAVINGNNVCTGSGVFNITGVNAGESVAWSLSNSSLASLSNSSSTQTTVTMNGSGDLGSLIATITNSCNQSVQKTFSLYSGIPTLKDFTCDSRGKDFCSGSVGVPYTYLPSLDLNDKITANFNGLTVSEATNNANWEWQVVNSNISLSKARNLARIGMMNFGQTGVRVRAKNACGWSDWQELNFEIFETQEALNRNQNTTTYTVYPNPTSEIINVVLKDKNAQVKKGKGTRISAQLYNMKEQLKSRAEIINNTASINVKGLEKGVYVLKININGQIENHRVVVD